MTKLVKKSIACSIAALYSFSATAGSFYDSYQSPNYASARKIVTVSPQIEAPENLVISTLCRDENQGPYEPCVSPMVVSENILRIIAIQESYEKLRIFNANIRRPKKDSNFAETSKEITLAATFLIPGLALFIPISSGVAVATYLGLWLVTLISNIDEDHVTNEQHLILLHGSAGLVLKALGQEGVAMSCSDCTDAIPGVYTRLGILAEQQQQQLDKVFARTQQLGMPSSQDILRLSQKFLGWAQHYHNELGKLTAQQAADFEGMVTKDLYTHEQALCVSAVNIATNLNSMLQSPSLDMREQSKILHDYAFLKMLADETM